MCVKWKNKNTHKQTNKKKTVLKMIRGDFDLVFVFGNTQSYILFFFVSLSFLLLFHRWNVLIGKTLRFNENK